MRPGTLVTRGDRGQRGASAADLSGERGGQVAVARRRAEGRRGGAMVAPERLGELGRLAIADAPGHLSDGQRAVVEQLGALSHRAAGKGLPEGGVPDLQEGGLGLAGGAAARGGEASEGQAVPYPPLTDPGP